ncbi:MAG: acyltransferase [Bacteroidota bacterium]|nr:acyltransferase [Bacteroidota bacterium]
MNQFKLRHLPELDALRTFAVVMVMLAHYLPDIGLRLPFSWYGVDLFFTISGFLITTILINAFKNNNGKNRLNIIKNFLIRRVFRLFPAYYFFLLFFWGLKNIFNIWIWRDEFTIYFFTYTPNWLFLKTGLNNAACFSHLWSLGVEEQFYLFWPWLLLFPPVKYRVGIILGMILISIILGFIYYDNSIAVLPFANFHTLGAGCLLAYFYTQNASIINWLKKYRMWIVTVSFVNLLIVLYFFPGLSSFESVYRALSLSICTAALVLVSIFGWAGVLKIVARNKLVQYIGKISYGIYLYHLPIPVLTGLILTRMHLHVNNVVLFFAYFAITFVIAAISYKYLEMPFLKLKKRFND